MTVGLVLDEVFLWHRPHDVHPERPERLIAVGKALAEAGLSARAEKLPIRSITDEELGRVHDAALIDLLEHEMPGKSGYLDGDTYFSPGSWNAARAAAAAAVDL